MRVIILNIILILVFHLVFPEIEAKQQDRNLSNSVKVEDIEFKLKSSFPEVTTDILAQKGGTAALPCKLSDPGVGIVTWIRRKDRQLLTFERNTHCVDKRFMVKNVNSEWSLLIKKVMPDDAGLYECQITSHPVQTYFIQLSVTEAYAVIPGAPDLHVKQGSNLSLECKLMSSTEAPLYVFWYRNSRMINYDSEPGLKVELTKTGSILEVKKAQLNHSGNYTCAPSNAKEAYVMVHVLEEDEKPAAMHGGDQRNQSSIILISNILICLMTLMSGKMLSFMNIYST